MSYTRIEKNFDDAVSGDSFDQVDFELIINNAPVDLTGCIIKVDFKKNAKSSTADKTIRNSGSNPVIVITDGPAGKFRWKEFVLDVPAAKYFYDVEFKFPSGRIRSYIYGYVDASEDVTDTDPT